MSVNDDFRSLVAQVGQGLGPGLVLESSTDEDVQELLALERDAAIDWAPQRRAQFAQGRACAHRGLRRLGSEFVPILSDANGAPIWPSGFVGSISHKRRYCVVIVGRSREFLGVGLDLDRDDRLKEESEALSRVCCSDSERSQVESLLRRARSPATWFLSAKEAFYKLHYSTSGESIRWDEIVVSFEGDRFVVGRLGTSLAEGGVVHRSGGWILSLLSRSAPTL